MELGLPNTCIPPLFRTVIFPTDSMHGVLSKDFTVQLDGARPANTFIPPLFCTVIFLTDFTTGGVLSKDLTVWLDGARPANTCIPL